MAQPCCEIMAEVAMRVEPHHMNLISQDPQPQSEYRTIPLSRGLFATIDAEDFDRVGIFSWYAAYVKNGASFSWYAVRNASRKAPGPRRIYMHRFIMNAPPDIQVDHRNPSETLINCKSNLRFATVSQNGFNRSVQKNNTVGIKGVGIGRHGNGYRARITFQGVELNLGTFPTKDGARAAYVAKALELHGEFARTQ
jgi:hypothetical protein